MQKQMRLLVEEYAPDADTAWAWARAMFEQGYNLSTDGGDKPVFVGHGVEVNVALRHGALAWRVLVLSTQATTVALPLVYHPDPVTAAVWWQVEKDNHPPIKHEAPPVSAEQKLMEAMLRQRQTQVSAPWLDSPWVPPNNWK